jgi:hypothetical protein
LKREFQRDKKIKHRIPSHEATEEFLDTVIEDLSQEGIGGEI